MGESARRIVLFLGAGASKPFGYPLTTGILPAMLAALRAKTLFPAAWRTMDGSGRRMVSASRALNDELSAFLPGAFGRRSRLPPVTDLLSLLDYLVLTGATSHADTTIERLRHLRGLLERGVATLLTRPGAQGAPKNEALLNRLVQWVLERERRSDLRTTIISTNYDTLLESRLYPALYANSLVNLDRIDFGFTWRAVNRYFPLVHRPQAARLGIFKLHGSLNWLKCPLCETVFINRRAQLMYLLFPRKREPESSCVCGYWPLQPVLVAPSIVRDVRDVNLLALWRSALEELRMADEWIIVGYSLPSEDIAIRSMLLRAYRGRDDQPRRPLPKVRVIVHPADTAARDRYRALFPEARVQRIGTEAFVRSLAA